ncbi:hypothetical protein VD0004_g7597 [Verticillium dahliae]|nr:hypothetical protein VD0004_g7597 [Verticillium dahliae]
MFDILEADIVIFQETKIQRKDLKDDMVLIPGWDVYFSLPKYKKGYSGVVIYTRNATCCPIRAEEGILGVLCPPDSTTRFRDLPEEQQIGGYPTAEQLSSDIDEATLDSEGRCVILEFPAFVLIGTYSPANRDESRQEFRLGYLSALDARVRNLVAAGKQVILTGDLNVSRSEIDTINLSEQLRKEDMTMDDWMAIPSRRLFNQLLFEGQVQGDRDPGREQPALWDICRCFHPDRKGMFTCWDTKRNTRPANNGARIDYLLCSAGIKDWFIDSNIQEGLHGSDHCPVYGTLGDTVKVDGQDVHTLDLLNPRGMVEGGKRLREWSPKDLLPMSAKLIPEFDRRRSIRDMFMKKPAAKAPERKTLLESSDTLGESKREPDSASAPNHETLSARSDQGVALAEPSGPNNTESKSLALHSPTKEAARPQASRPPTKRAAPTTQQSIKASKKSKTNDSQSAAKGNTGSMAQSTLMGFFKPKQAARDVTPAAVSSAEPPSPYQQTAASNDSSPIKSPAVRVATSSTPDDQTQSPTRPGPPSSTSLSLSAMDSAETVFDPIQVKETWSKLQLGKRVAPKCEHEEPCISLLTKKPGVNCGRSFYICARPLGPSGEKEKGTQWRCGTFIWSSDWKKGKI